MPGIIACSWRRLIKFCQDNKYVTMTIFLEDGEPVLQDEPGDHDDSVRISKMWARLIAICSRLPDKMITVVVQGGEPCIVRRYPSGPVRGRFESTIKISTESSRG